MWRRAAVAVLSLVGVAACTNETSTVEVPAAVSWSWEGTTDFTPEERTQIQEGLDFICARTGRSCSLIQWTRAPGDERPGAIVRFVWLPGNPNTGGCCDGGNIRLGSHVFIRRVAAHEFGHWVGMMDLPHEFSDPPKETGLMDHYILSNDFEWTDADEAECQRVRCRD